MLSHQKIYNTLQKAFPNNVCTVARYETAPLDLPGRRAHIFIPDFHMLSKKDAKLYPKKQFLQQKDLLKLLDRLTDLKKKNPGELQVWHLGDMFDLWRAKKGNDPAGQVARIATDYPKIIDRFWYGAPHGVGARGYIMAGNHDYNLLRLPEWRAVRFRIIQNDDPKGGDMLVLHGDIFNFIERAPDKLQAAAVKIAKWVSSGKKKLYNDEKYAKKLNKAQKKQGQPIGRMKATLSRAIVCNGNLPSEGSINVIRGEAGNPKAKNKKYYKGAKALATALRKRGHNIRLIVIGHSHWARMIEGTIGNDPFVLMDCGAWIGYCQLEKNGGEFHSAQIGVKAEGELRIYQLGRRPKGT